MKPQPNSNGPFASGIPLPEANLLTKQDSGRILRTLYDQAVQHGPHPDDHPTIMKRLQRERLRIVLTVNWVVMKLGQGQVADLTDEEVHRMFNDVAAGKSFTRPRRMWRWVCSNWAAIAGWAAAGVAGLILTLVLVRPVNVAAPAVPAPQVIEREKIPATIYFRKSGDHNEAWEGTGDPKSGVGRWIRVEFKNPP